MKTLDEIIKELQDGKYCDRCRVFEPALINLRNSGVFVERGTRAWAVAMYDSGKRFCHKTINGGRPCPIDDDEELSQYISFTRKGYELAPPAEREVPRWEALKAWDEGKQIGVRESPSSKIDWYPRREHFTDLVFAGDGSGTWYIREPEGGK